MPGPLRCGSPDKTSEGLTCSDDGSNDNVKVNAKSFTSGDGIELKAGSKRHQHIVGFEDPKGGEARFALVALDLPAAIDKNSGKSD